MDAGLDFVILESMIQWITSTPVIHWISPAKNHSFGTRLAPMKPVDESRLAETLAQIARNTSERGASVPQSIDVAALRKRIGVTQREFARRFGVPVATLRHWEHGDRTPRGPALVLLNLIARNPRAVFLALVPTRS